MTALGTGSGDGVAVGVTVTVTVDDWNALGHALGREGDAEDQAALLAGMFRALYNAGPNATAQQAAHVARALVVHHEESEVDETEVGLERFLEAIRAAVAAETLGQPLP